MKSPISGLNIEEIKNCISVFGEKPYRAIQVYEALNKKLVSDFDSIKTVPLNLRNNLKQDFIIEQPDIIKTSKSESDKTIKFLFRIADEEKNEYIYIESVLMEEKGRVTLCISTQAGCNAGCIFCATGLLGLKKNISAGVIVNQVYEIIRNNYTKPTNIVFMGMGEPFLNFENTIIALRILTSENGLDYSSKRLTVSTIGVKGNIKRFADELVKEGNSDIRHTKLAISLHSTDKGIRESLIPLSKKTPLPELYEEITYFYKTTGTKVTYEYIFFEGINDTENDIKRISGLSKMIPCNFNIIPFHPIDQGKNIFTDLKTKKIYSQIFSSQINSLSNEKIFYFIEELRENGVVVNLRSSNGIEIDAACGQLAAKMEI